MRSLTVLKVLELSTTKKEKKKCWKKNIFNFKELLLQY